MGKHNFKGLVLDLSKITLKNRCFGAVNVSRKPKNSDGHGFMVQITPIKLREFLSYYILHVCYLIALFMGSYFM